MWSSSAISYTRTRHLMCGSISLFAAVIVIPSLMLLLSMAFDLSSYFWEQQRVQKIIDDAAVYGYRYLPREAESISAVRSYLDDRKLPTGAELSVTVAPEVQSLTIEYVFDVPLTFARGAAFILGGGDLSEISLPVRVSTAVRGTPFDVAVAMDASSYLAPSATIPADLMQPCSFESWGSAQEATAHTVFGGYPVFCNNREVPPAVSLERCFNPRFSAVKSTAIQLIEYFSASRLNGVGVIVYPGIPAHVQDPWWAGSVPDAGATESIRSLGQAAPARAVDPAVRFSRYQDYLGANEACQAAIEAGHLFGAIQYRYPGQHPTAPRSLATVQQQSIPPRYSDWEVQAHEQQVSVIESLWSQVARVTEAAPIVDLMASLRAQLFVGGVYGSTRGGMVGREAKAAFVVAGDLPVQGGSRFGDGSGVVEGALAQELSHFRSIALERGADVRLYYIVVEHTSHPLSGASVGVEQMRELFADYAFHELDGSGGTRARFDGTAFTLRVSGSDRTAIEERLSDVLGAVVLERRGGVIAY